MKLHTKIIAGAQLAVAVLSGNIAATAWFAGQTLLFVVASVLVFYACALAAIIIASATDSDTGPTK